MYQEERIYKILEILKAKKTMTNQEIMDQVIKEEVIIDEEKKV